MIMFVFAYVPHPLRLENFDSLFIALYKFCALRALMEKSERRLR